MKRLLALLITTGALVAIAVLITSRHWAEHEAQKLKSVREAWAVEKAALEAALAEADVSQLGSQPAIVIQKSAEMATPDATALLEQLTHLKTASGQGRAMRPVIALLEQLAQVGPPALPIIQSYLHSGEDIVYVPVGGRAVRNAKSLTDALVPATLRFGLFDVVRQIGGTEAEKILAENITNTKRGIEVVYLTQLLEELAPGIYKETILTATRSLLTGSTGVERDYLFSVLQRFNDTSYVATAKGEVIQSDGKVDRGALRYLQQTLGEQSVAVAAQLYQDDRLSEQGSREPLARVALAYVGANEQAGELYHAAVLDPSLQPDQKRELVEDLNQDGLGSTKNPTADDMKIIANRYALTQAYLQQDYVQNDKVLNAAFREADKDLRRMLERAAAAQQSQQGK